MTSLLDAFADAVMRHPERVAIVDGAGRETSFAALQARADGFARAWQAQGIGPGDRVLLAMPLDADLYAALAGLWQLGAVVVLPEPAMGLAGVRHAAEVAGVTAFCSAGAYGLLRFVLPVLWGKISLRPKVGVGAVRAVAIAASDIALISFTSGTSGAPKAIPRSHGFLMAQQAAIAPLLACEGAPRDLVAFPVFVLINIAAGRTSVLPSWKMSRLGALSAAHLTGWIEAQGVTRLLIPPSLCEKLGRMPETVPASVQHVFTGGGPVFPDVVARMRVGRPGMGITCVYGSSEAEPIAHLEAEEIAAQDLAAMLAGQGLLVGRPVPGLKLRIMGDEIQVAGAHVNGGYLNPAHDAENKILEDGVIWHRTGDAGYLDARGRLWLLGRIGTQAKTQNGPRYPFAVEVAAHGWEGVAQCALVRHGAEACLVIAGDARHLAEWQARAQGVGIATVRVVARIPMDRRHASKIDRAALAKVLG